MIVALGEFSAVSPMVAAAGRVEQRFPEEILELDLPHAEAAAMGIGGDRVAAHGFGADAERQLGAAERDRVGGLHDHLDAGAADALHHMAGVSCGTPE